MPNQTSSNSNQKNNHFFSVEDLLRRRQENSSERANLNENLKKIFFEKAKEENFRIVYSAEERARKSEIKSIQEELKKLIKKTEHIDLQIKRAVHQPVLENSEYELSFLISLKLFIRNIFRQIEDASSFFAEAGKRKSKRNRFWNTVHDKEKGGSQYLLSSEHYASRSGA